MDKARYGREKRRVSEFQSVGMKWSSSITFNKAAGSVNALYFLGSVRFVESQNQFQKNVRRRSFILPHCSILSPDI